MRRQVEIRRRLRPGGSIGNGLPRLLPGLRYRLVTGLRQVVRVKTFAGQAAQRIVVADAVAR